MPRRYCAPPKWDGYEGAFSLEGDGDGSGFFGVDGHEVAVIRGQVTVGGLLVLGFDHPGVEAVAVRVGDQRVPFGVDVLFHATHGADVLQDLRE